MKPRLMRSAMTDQIYVVTTYKELGDGRFEAKTKHLVTEDFMKLTIAECPSCGGAGGFGFETEPMASEECKRCDGLGEVTVAKVLAEWQRIITPKEVPAE